MERLEIKRKEKKEKKKKEEEADEGTNYQNLFRSVKHLLPVALYAARLFAKRCRQGQTSPETQRCGWRWRLGVRGGREGVVVVVGALSRHHAVKKRIFVH